MPRRATGQVLVDSRRKSPVYAIRFKANGRRQYVTLGSARDGWTQAKAHDQLERELAAVRLGTWTLSLPEPATLSADERRGILARYTAVLEGNFIYWMTGAYLSAGSDEAPQVRRPGRPIVPYRRRPRRALRMATTPVRNLPALTALRFAFDHDGTSSLGFTASHFVLHVQRLALSRSSGGSLD